MIVNLILYKISYLETNSKRLFVAYLNVFSKLVSYLKNDLVPKREKYISENSVKRPAKVNRTVGRVNGFWRFYHQNYSFCKVS